MHISPISSACLAQRHTNILRHAWKHAHNLLMTCYPSERDWLFPWQWPPSLFVQLTRTQKDRVTQTGRHTNTLSPHQGTVLIPSCQQQGRGEARTGRGLIHSFIQTLAWCRSTPYMDSFLAFSRNWASAWAGVIPLNTQKREMTTIF